MTMLRTQASLLLALLPAFATRNLLDGGDLSLGADKTDPTPGSEPMGRQGVLELLESGMISTDEALDLLDGIDQTSATGSSASDADGPGRGRRSQRLLRPERPGRPIRPGRRGSDEGERERDVQFQENDRGDEESVPIFTGRRTIRIRVDDAGGSRVNLALPIGFLETGLKVAERFSPGVLGGPVGTSIRQAIGSGQSGTIIDVQDAAGSHVRIAIE